MKSIVGLMALVVAVAALGATSLHAQPPYSGYQNSPYSTGPYQGTMMSCYNFVLKQGTTTLISNSSGAATTPYNTYYGGITPGNMIPGAQHTIDVTTNGQYPTWATAWVDYNNDGDFNDSGEYLGQSATSGSNGQVVRITFNAPTNVGGVKRLRMRTNYSTPGTSPTAQYSFGEAEDYLVNLGFAIETASPLPVGALTQSYSAIIRAVNGVGTYNWAGNNGIINGALPAGLQIRTLSNDEVEIYGTPTAITPVGTPASITISVTDSDSPPETAVKDFDITVLPQPAALPLTENFSNPVGWQISGPWQIGSATSYSQSSPPCSEPSTDHTASTSDNKILGDTIGGKYTVNDGAVHYAISPMVDCSSATNVRVQFFAWLGLAIGSEVTVDVSANGNTWTNAWTSISGLTYGGSTNPSAGYWEAYHYDITAVAAGSGTVQVRIGIGPTGGTNSTGWCIDDFVIEEPADDLHIEEQLPAGGPGTQIWDDDTSAGMRAFGTVASGTNNGPVTFFITNDGPTPIKFGTTTIPVFTKSGNNPSEFYVSAGGMSNPLQPGQTTTFAVTFNSGSGTGNYSMTLELNHDADYSGTTPFDINFTATAAVLAPTLEVRMDSTTGPIVTHDLPATSAPTRDFGQQDINAGPTAPRTIVIMNTGTGPMALNTPDMGGTWWQDYTLNTSTVTQTLNAGASVSIEVAFDPTTVGQKDADVRIYSNDPTKPFPYLVPVTGVGTTSNNAGLSVHDGTSQAAPSISYGAVAAGQRDFGQQLVAGGATPAITITIHNPGGAQLNVSTPTLTGPNPGEFILSTVGFNGAVPSGGSTSFTIAFDPTAVGQMNASIEFTHNDSTQTSPFEFFLTGMGVNVAPAMIVRETDQNGTVLTNPAAATGILNFGVIDVNAGPSTETVWVRNAGTAPLMVNAPAFTATTTEYSLGISGFQGTLQVNDTATFTITFDPTVAGTHTGVIEFTHNDAAAGSPFVLNVTGDATLNAPIIEVHEDNTIGPIVTSGATAVTGSSRNLGLIDVGVGGSFPAIVSVRNTGNLPLTLGTPTLAGPEAAQFSLSAQGFAGNLAAGTDIGFSVTCNPTTGGNKDCWVEFTQNDPGQPSPYIVRFRCTGNDPAAVQISTIALPSVLAGAQMQAYQMQAIQGVGVLTWSIYDGALPAGVTIDGFGLITGTPTGFGGTNDVTIRVADTTGATSERQYTFVVSNNIGGRRASDSGCAASESGTPFGLALLAILGLGAYAIRRRRTV